MTSFKLCRPLYLLPVIAGLWGLVAPLNVGAASTDIANEPLITMSDITTKPNIMFILDSSGSMDSEYMPDNISSSLVVGYRSSQCNGLAYNPNVQYDPPLDATGAAYANSSFSAAWSNGFTGGGTVNLATSGGTARIGTSTAVAPGAGSKTFNINSSSIELLADSFTVGKTITFSAGSGSSRSTITGTVSAWSRSTQSSGTLTINVTSYTGSTSYSSWSYTLEAHYYRYSGSQPAMGWTYAGTNGDVVTTTTFYTECMTPVSSAHNPNFTMVRVTATSPDATNYANWYSYYRKRILLMRTAVGKAFSGLGSGYRVGFTTIKDTGVTDGTNYFRDVKTFDITQKTNFYSSLYDAPAGDYTPLRGALSKVGKYFANKASGQSYDPMEYSCQRNYAILSTDGYWNTDIESSSFGPFKLDGASVDNQDATEDRPMKDNTTASTIRTRTRYAVVKGTGTGRGGNGCSTSNYLVTSTPQTYNNNTSTWTSSSSSSSCVSGSTVVVNGSTAAALVNTTTNSPETVTPTTIGGSSNSLADVAEYYYKTDLRTAALGNCTSTTSGGSQDVCSNSLEGSGRDTATWQHMTTFTIGLGVSGTLAYDKNYLTQTSGSYKDLSEGRADWPVPYDGAGAVNIDDLWHAAVNGRGQYYSALNSEELSEAINGVVTTIQEITGSASSASTNTLELVPGGNNRVYQASYTTSSWKGDINAYSINAETAVIDTSPVWSAQSILDATNPASRVIYFNKSGNLTSFLYDNMLSAQKAYFDGLCSKSVVAAQCGGLSVANLAQANTGSNLINYLRGDRGNESRLYRARSSVLGDIINSTPVYVGPPLFGYSDAGYSAFKSASASRTPVLYSGANDGMLHAFNAATGAEMWAFIPTAVLPNLYKLADSSYSSRHVYFVDGTPVIGDVFDGANWRTILVGGLNDGGMGYYALDVTVPENPILLWEFSNANLGLSYGNPIIAKRADGTWTVALTSGYNNTSGDGEGHLFLVDAITGGLLLDISTGQGTSSSPSGLAKINAWIADSSDNTVMRYYGGDLLGNLWRFDVDNLVMPHQAALRLAEFRTGTGDVQPITIQPRLKQISSYPVVVIGTGRYLGTSDITDTTTQTIAAVKDPLTATGWGLVRTNSTMVEQTLTVSGATVTGTSREVDWSIKNGWWFDLPTRGERIVTGMALSGNALYAGSAVPSGAACKSGGSSWLYGINVLTGGPLGEESIGMAYDTEALIVGMTVVITSTGETKVLVKDSTGKTVTKDSGGGGGGGAATSHRTSWRELVD